MTIEPFVKGTGRLEFSRAVEFDNMMDERRIPYSAFFELTYKCNLKCIHCYANIPHHGKELSFKEVISVLEQLADAGTLHITFSGGEPFIRKDFMDILSYARKLDFATVILTNATLITEDIADRISSLFPLLIKATLYGATRKMYGRVTGNPKLYHRAMRGIRLLAEREIPMIIASYAFNFNTVKDMLAIKRICQGVGVKWRVLSQFNYKANGDSTPLRYELSESQFEKFSRGIPKLLYSFSSAQKQFKKKAENNVVCRGLQSGIYINPYGQIGSCHVLASKSSIREKSLLEIWRNDPLLEKQRNIRWKDLPVCLKCKSLSYCYPCPGANFLATGSFTKISTDYCQFAHKTRKVCLRLCSAN